MNLVDGTAYSVIHAALLRRVERGGLDADGDRALIEDAIRAEVTDYQRRAHLDDHLTALATPEQLVARLLQDLCDFGPLSPLLEADDVEEIFIHGTRIAYRASDGRVHWLVSAATEAQNRQYVERLLQTADADDELSASRPYVSAGLPGGARVSVKIPPIVNELTVAIRRVTLRRPTLAGLVARGSMTPGAASLLWALLQVRSRILVAGVPGAGKTTLIAALLAAVPATRVVRVNEHAAELNVRLMLGGYARATDRPGQTLRDLVAMDLRFSPELMVIGEVRGAEAFEAVLALNAGCGFLSSLHANDASHAIRTFADRASLAGERVDHERLLSIFADAIDVVVFLDADVDDGPGAQPQVRHRQLLEIAAINPELRNGQVIAEPIFVREDLGAPLRWTGLLPDARLTRRLERTLPAGASLAGVLDGHVRLGSWGVAA